MAPTYQRADRLRRLVGALERQDHPPDRFEVVVVDDGSTDCTSEVLADLIVGSPIRLRSLQQARNRGPAVARNAGWRAAEAEVIAFIDDDCTPGPGWVTAMTAAFARNDRLGVAQGNTRPQRGQGGPWTVARAVGDETPWFEGCNIGYRRAALEATGGFDETLAWYGEDTSAGWKVVDAGWERDFVADAVVIHDLEDRGILWRVRHAWLEHHLVELAARHPGLRRTALWRSWAFRRESVTLPLAVAGALAATRRPAAVVLALPYLAGRRSLLRRPLDLCAFALVDAVGIVAHLRGSLANRVMVL